MSDPSLSPVGTCSSLILDLNSLWLFASFQIRVLSAGRGARHPFASLQINRDGTVMGRDASLCTGKWQLLIKPEPSGCLSAAQSCTW